MRNPIFLVPGLGGTRLKECNSTRLVWLNAPLYLDCTSKLIRMLDVIYNHEGKRFESKYAVKPDRDMGDLRSISNISEPPTDVCNQFDAMIRYFEKVAGYNPGENLFGVPYDWRIILDPEYWEFFESKLRELIEKQQEYCPRIRCTFIALSMGGLVITKFLSKQTSEWKKQYIDKVITIGTPFGGTPRACLSLCNGIEDVTGLDNYFIKELFKNCAGTYLCQPNKKCFSKLELIKNYKSKSYRVNDMEDMFDLEIFNTKMIKLIFKDTYQEIADIMDNGPGPEVEVHVIAGSSRDTVIALDYSDNDCPKKIKESDVFTDTIFGDGVVPHLSASYWCNKKYSDGTAYIKSMKVYQGSQYIHSDLSRQVNIMDYILSLLDISSIEDLMIKC